MPHEIGGFQTAGPSWAERAEAGELNAVISPTGPDRSNRFVHSTQLVVARIAAALTLRSGVVIDFGCGTGRFLRYFGSKGYRMVGTEITLEMLRNARRFGVPSRTLLLRTDGVIIPAQANSVDLIWCCTVLRYSLLVTNPVYADIVREMYRVLKPGGRVVNLEMYVDNPPQTFVRDFEATGFRTRYVGVLHRWSGRLESGLQFPGIPNWFLPLAGKLCAAVRLLVDNPHRKAPGLRDYMFVFSKPVR
jgi:ubiquinone/menaquinone biosynthesis C-methylase UbiE